MKKGSKVKILDKNSKYYGEIGILEEPDIEGLPICSVYFDDDDFDFFSDDEIEEVG